MSDDAGGTQELEEALSRASGGWERIVLWLPVGLFLAGGLVALLSSPVLRADLSAGGDGGSASATTTVVTLPAPRGEVRIGSWDGEPRCHDDRRDDVEVSPASRPRAPDAPPQLEGGPGDLTSVCVSYARRLVVEARMEEPVTQEPDDRDEATLEVVVDASEDDHGDYGILVTRQGEQVVATVDRDYDVIPTPACAGAAAWRDTVVRVEVDPACLAEPVQVGVRAELTSYDTDDFAERGDVGLSGSRDGTARVYADYRRVPRYDGPSSGFATLEAAIASTVGRSYAGNCGPDRGWEPTEYATDEVCSRFAASGTTGETYALVRMATAEVIGGVVVAFDEATQGWTVVDDGLRPDEVPERRPCPPEDPACDEGDV